MTAQDGTGFPLEAGPFDAILLDAPCSCEGNVRQGTGTRWERPDEFLQGRSGLQATLLGRAWKLLAPGGRLVYATCTFAPEETEMVLDYSLSDDARIEPVTVAGLRHAPGVTAWCGKRLRPDCAHVARFWPHFNDTGGFTVALVRKQALEAPTTAGNREQGA
jgi:16S rRNA C967 or C1407 C5-methylase (RsmB/RsmF family)